MTTQRKKWTTEEDNRLLRQIEAFPHNLNKCFFIVSQELTEQYESEGTGAPRTPTACAARWYTVLSKRPNITQFATISKHHLSRNRKNGMGIPINYSVWRRFMTLIRNFIS